MKIPPTSSGVQGSTSTGATSGAGDAARTNKSAANTSATSFSGGDSVKISSLSTQLQSGLSGPEFDRAKVDKIKAAISDGSLTVNSSVIADKILSTICLPAEQAALNPQPLPPQPPPQQ